MEKAIQINIKIKDSLFRTFFGDPERKIWALWLYNALNGTHYTDLDAFTFTTLDNAVYMHLKNDVSFLLYNTMNFYEQQSTFNPNMPMRFLMYAGKVYSNYIEQTKSYHRFSSKLQKAPAPKCVCFYNGTSEQEDVKTLKLSDAFDGDSDIEVKVTMININYGRNKELLDACPPLKDYSFFVARVRFHQKSTNLEEAVDAAIDDLPDDSVVKPFLMKNKAEVKMMCITEYDEARTLNEQREEGREEGKKEGINIGVEKGKLALLIKLVTNGTFSVFEAAEMAEMPLEEFEAKTGLTA